MQSRTIKVARMFQTVERLSFEIRSSGMKKRWSSGSLTLPPTLTTSQLNTKSVMPIGARRMRPDRKDLRSLVNMDIGMATDGSVAELIAKVHAKS